MKTNASPVRAAQAGSAFPRLVAAASVVALLTQVASTDTLVTNDNRVLQVKKARQVGEEYQLHFEHGEVLCPADYVQSVEIEGDMSDYVPKNDNERKKLEDGFIRYKGRWWKKAAYERELDKGAERTRERTAYLAEHSEWHNAWEEETKHFIIRTNASEELLEYYADLMEAWYDLLDDRIGIKPPPQLRRTKMRVNIFKSREEFHDLNAAGLGGGVAGYFSFLDESLNFYHDFQEPAISDWIALHEGTHLLTYLIEPQGWPQIWINEGIADYLGSAEIVMDERKGGIKEIHPGRVQTDRILTVQNAMKDGSFVNLEKLFRVEKSGFSAFEYAHAWSFVYFLNNSKKQYKKGFDKFFKDIYTLPKGIEYEMVGFPNKEGTAKIAPPEEVRRVLLKHLKVDDVQALEAEWKEFISGIQIDTPEALFKRGYRATLWGDDEEEKQAVKDLNEAINGGVTDPRAYWARGKLRSWDGNRSGAISDYRKAIELSPLNASFRFDLARELSGHHSFYSSGSGRVTIRVTGRGSSRDRGLEGTDEELEDARINFGLAMEMDPKNHGYRQYYEDYLETLERHREKQGEDGEEG